MKDGKLKQLQNTIISYPEILDLMNIVTQVRKKEKTKIVREDQNDRSLLSSNHTQWQ